MSWKAAGYVKEMVVAPNGVKLTRTEKLVALVLADYHQMGDKHTFPSIATMAGESLMDERMCRRTIASLEEKGVILRVKPDLQYRGVTTFYTFPEVDKEGAHTPLKKPKKEGDKGGGRGAEGGQKTVPNIEEQEQEQELKESTLSADAGESDPVDPFSDDAVDDADEKFTPREIDIITRAFGFYCKVLGRDPKRYSLTKKRLEKGIRRLRERNKIVGEKEAMDEIARAIRNVAANQYLMDGGYIDWEDQIFKSAEEFEKRVNWQPPTQRSQKSDEQNKRIDSGNSVLGDWAARAAAGAKDPATSELPPGSRALLGTSG